MFVDLHGATNAFPQELTVVRETMFFSAVGSDDERELYSSDGTPDGTGRLKDFAGIASSSPHNLTAIDDILYFSASLSTGESELFMSDGTSAGTGLVKNLAGNPDPREIVAFVPSFEASRNLPIDPNVEIAERPKSIANRDRESRSRDLIANIFQQTNWQ